MGVLNIHEHLRHRRNRDVVENHDFDDVLEEEVSEPANIQPPQQEPNQRRHTRNRSQKSKIQYYNSRNTGRKAKTGNRPMRRHENMCFLLSLVDHEEIGELDFSDIVSSKQSMFATLLTNEENMKRADSKISGFAWCIRKMYPDGRNIWIGFDWAYNVYYMIWNEFVSLSEEEQEVIISRKTKTMAPDKDTNWGNTNEDRNIPTEQDAMAIAEKSFNRIEDRIRGTLKKKRFPMGGLKHHEEVISYFSDDPSAIMISTVPSSFDRLLVHGVCQFLDLKSISVNHNGDRIMEIENNQETFCVPSLLLSQYLEQHR